MFGECLVLGCACSVPMVLVFVVSSCLVASCRWNCCRVLFGVRLLVVSGFMRCSLSGVSFALMFVRCWASSYDSRGACCALSLASLGTLGCGWAGGPGWLASPVTLLLCCACGTCGQWVCCCVQWACCATSAAPCMSSGWGYHGGPGGAIQRWVPWSCLKLGVEVWWPPSCGLSILGLCA